MLEIVTMVALVAGWCIVPLLTDDGGTALTMIVIWQVVALALAALYESFGEWRP